MIKIPLLPPNWGLSLVFAIMFGFVNPIMNWRKAGVPVIKLGWSLDAFPPWYAALWMIFGYYFAGIPFSVCILLIWGLMQVGPSSQHAITERGIWDRYLMDWKRLKSFHWDGNKVIIDYDRHWYD